MSSLSLPSCTLNNVKMVIFDKDGTLIDVHHYWCSMIEFRASFFTKSLEMLDNKILYNELIDNMGIDIKTKKMKPEGPVGIKPRSFIVNVVLETILKYDNSYTKEKVEDIFLEVDVYSKTKLDKIVKPLPEVEEFLISLKKSNIEITIATTDLRQRALLAMEILKWKDFFIDIVGSDLVENAKPSSDLVDYILEKHSLSVKDVVLIGDSMADLGMAENAKCRFIGVKTGLYTDDFLNKSENLVENVSKIKVVI